MPEREKREREKGEKFISSKGRGERERNREN